MQCCDPSGTGTFLSGTFTGIGIISLAFFFANPIYDWSDATIEIEYIGFRNESSFLADDALQMEHQEAIQDGHPPDCLNKS
jgi:hypothetical protein